ncbi:MAG: sugar phosphate isomerase/epimerase [Ardenticatenaceae bacterium]|nr:sugar phosphate isomerase/epimerase [Ardenticatenaceae bacterium]MCB9443440.1 sugar phosphate isomerase/epimerase [Ardenticatenaceae bacterium]
MNPMLGLQLWSVRNALQEDYLGTLEKVAEIGYKNLELITTVTDKGLIFGNDLSATQLKRYLEDTGLRAVGCHIVPVPGMNWERVVADLKELGVHHLGCAIAFFNNRQEVLDFCKTFNKDAEFCKKNGIQYHYHNHFHEFQAFEGESIFDTMLDNLDKDLVLIEFDTYWAMRGGQDPVAWIKKLGHRCDLLHQKDMPAEAQPVNWFDHFGPERKLGLGELIETTAGDSQFTEVGQGVMDIPAILEAGRTYGQVEYIFVEQDKSARSELESIAISYNYLSELLKN